MAGRRMGHRVGGMPWTVGMLARVWEQAGPPGQRSLEHRWWPRRPPAHAAAGSTFCPVPRPSGNLWQQKDTAWRGGNLHLELQ